MKLRAAALLALTLCALVASASAEEYSLLGLWRVGDGSAVIEVKPCGEADICGVVASAPAPAPGEKPAVGQQILVGMKRVGNLYRGSIFNIDDGKTYDGEISLSGPDRLEIRGCQPNGGLCGGETWKREPKAP